MKTYLKSIVALLVVLLAASCSDEAIPGSKTDDLSLRSKEVGLNKASGSDVSGTMSRAGKVFYSVRASDYDGKMAYTNIPVSGRWRVIVARQGGASIRVRYDINGMYSNFDAPSMGSNYGPVEEGDGYLRVNLFSDPANSYITYHLMVIQVP